MNNAPDSRPLPLASIDPSRDTPRRDFDAAALDSLARSIARVGLLEPVIVRLMGERFELVAGERRYRACLQLGFETIPAIVRDLEDLHAAEIRLLENLDPGIEPDRRGDRLPPASRVGAHARDARRAGSAFPGRD